MVHISRISKEYPTINSQIVEVLRHIDFTIENGEFITILGPNGCGKTTLLEIVSGLTKSSGGTILFDGQKTGRDASVAMVCQDYKKSLLPWLTVKQNILFPLALRRIETAEQERRLRHLCDGMRCTVDIDRYPYQLSGGQQQMVSILRGLIMNPDLYLFDEPFSSLDYQSKLLMLQRLHDTWTEKRISTLYVSHDIDEAVFLSQKIVVLSNKPSTIRNVFENPLPLPRTVSMVGSPDFSAFKRRVLSSYLAQL